MYSPIIGGNDEYSGHEPVVTDQNTMERTSKLQTAYDDLRTDLLDEVQMVDTKIIKPAMEAKDCIHPLKKVIKKRGDKKVSPEIGFDDVVADACSLTLRNTRTELIVGERRLNDQRGIMRRWRKQRWSWCGRKR